MQEKLIDIAKNIIINTGLTGLNDNDRYLSGLTIYIGASSHDDAIYDLAENYRNVFKELGAKVLVFDREANCLFDKVAHKTLNQADYIIMLAATPGISAKVLYLCWIMKDFEKNKACVKDNIFIYMPSEFSGGFICNHIKEYGVNLYHLKTSEFSLDYNGLFKKCLYNISNKELNRRSKKMVEEMTYKPKIGIIVALHIEFKAVNKILNNVSIDHVKEENCPYEQYVHGTIKSKCGNHHNIVLAKCGKGNIKSSVMAQRLLTKYSSIKEIFMVGIAAGVPDIDNAEQHVRLGDIVVCGENGVIQYDMVKKNTYKTEYTPPSRPTSHDWLNRLEILINLMSTPPVYWSYLDEILIQINASRPHTAPLKDSPWIDSAKAVKQPHIKGHDKTRPRIHTGTIGSSDTVLKSAKIRDKLKNIFKIRAIEMEASGIAEATWQSGKGYFVIRGICDFANDDKNKKWQPYAAAAAAAFTRELIESMPLVSTRENLE